MKTAKPALQQTTVRWGWLMRLDVRSQLYLGLGDESLLGFGSYDWWWE